MLENLATRPKWMGTYGAPSDQYAFACGYMTHFASDVFGHSYICSHVGDIFEITNDPEGAARHTALETYIKKHTPPFLDANGTNLGSHHNGT